MGYTQDSAEVVALGVLAWLAADDELLPLFLGSTGASEADLRARADDPVFLGAVLDFLMMDDAWVIAYCDTQGMAYEDIQVARQALPGGGEVHWT